jgi:acetyltransferase-like isoleucine patch superfamily enzyme
MSGKYKVYPNVRIGKNAQIDDNIVIGYPPKGKKPGEIRTVIGDNAFIRSHTVIYAGNRIGDGFSTGHNVLIRELNNIGNNVSIGSHTVVEHRTKIMDNVRIHSNCFICEYSILGKKVWIGPCVIFTNALHPLCPHLKKCIKGPAVREGAKIGAGSILLPRVEIGKGSLIGAGAVIVKDIPQNKVAVGSPGRVIKDISRLRCPFGYTKHPYRPK